ncbi:MAG: succinate dehydrogenase, cytochrome b556 subunit [Thermoleophilia bacterium]|nr:succinate dehydrogenase, cytochrome b556 subunit [Thermoleophilia bacterium]
MKAFGKKKPRELANVGAGLWKATGMWAWLLFRISGLVLVFYLIAHIFVTSTVRWGKKGETFDSIMELFEKPVFVFLDLVLVGAVLYHALNGVRVMLMDVGVSTQRHKVLFWSAMIVVVICFAIFAWVSLTYIITGKGVAG